MALPALHAKRGASRNQFPNHYQFHNVQRLKMLPICNNTRRTPRRHPGAFLRAMQMLLTLAAAGFLLPIPAFTQSSDFTHATKAGVIGTVADADSDPIPNATVVLAGANGNRV